MAKTHRVKVFCLLLVTLVAILFTTRQAHAYWGVAYGRAWMVNHNGGYCPNLSEPGRDCTGSQYLESDHDQGTPVRNAQFFIYTAGIGIVGQGVSNDDGNFAIYWQNPNMPVPNDSYVFWIPHQKDGYFQINFPDGNIWWYPTWHFSLPRNTFYPLQWEPMWGADGWDNAYWAAELGWRTIASTVGGLAAYFSAEFRGFTDDYLPNFAPQGPSMAVAPQCNCAENCNSTRAKFGTGTEYNAQGVTLHEMGHCADWTEPFEWDCPNWGIECDRNGGWGYETDECKFSGWEDAMAQHLADVTLWWEFANEPHSCGSGGGYCFTDFWNLETSSYPNCIATEDRHPVSHMRFLWDVFDNNSDYFDNVAEGGSFWWRTWDVLQYYPLGIGDYQRDEIFGDTAHTWTDFLDGHSGSSFAYHYDQQYGVSLAMPYINNCGI
jgi:hypothetical protein